MLPRFHQRTALSPPNECSPTRATDFKVELTIHSNVRHIIKGMTRAEFLKSFDEILELDPGTLQGPERLEDFPLWDSTAMISFMALADSNNRASLVPRDMAACETIEDLLKLAQVG